MADWPDRVLREVADLAVEWQHRELVLNTEAFDRPGQREEYAATADEARAAFTAALELLPVDRTSPLAAENQALRPALEALLAAGQGAYTWIWNARMSGALERASNPDATMDALEAALAGALAALAGVETP